MTTGGHTVSVRQLRNSTADVIRQLEDGVEVTLTSRGTPVARLVPLHSSTPGRELLDAIDLLGVVDTGLADDVEKARLADAERDIQRW